MAEAHTQAGLPWQRRHSFSLEEKGKRLWRRMKDKVKGCSETEDMSYPSSSTSSYASSGDLSWDGSCSTTSISSSGACSIRSIKSHHNPVDQRLENWMEANALEGAIRPRDWGAMLASPTYQDHRNLIKCPTLKKIGFIEGSTLITYEFLQRRWVVTAFLRPVQAIIQRVWSAGADLLVQLSSPYATPSLVDPCFLWNPFKNAFSLLPSFCSILNVITLSYGVFGASHAIVAIGSTSSNKLLIEVLVLNIGTNMQWQNLGELNESVEILPESDFVEYNGSFYTYCVSPPQTFLEIKIDAPWVVFHQNMPYFEHMPRLVVCCNFLFLVDNDNDGEHYRLWRFQPECVEYPWGLLLLEVPKVSGSLNFVSVKGYGSLLYFFYANGETFLYSLERPSWSKIPDCPTQQNMFPIIMEEQAPFLV